MNYLFITLFGIGNVKIAPGSFASFFTCVVIYILFHLLNLDKNIILLILLFVFLLSIISIEIYIKNFKNEDPQEVVIDEFIGQSIPISLYEIAHFEPTSPARVLTFYFIMFILFRIFDIAKPYPVSYYDKNFKNSFGVIMDDVCAGLYVVAILVLYMIIFA